jgi:hypothetical protein
MHDSRESPGQWKWIKVILISLMGVAATAGLTTEHFKRNGQKAELDSLQQKLDVLQKMVSDLEQKTNEPEGVGKRFHRIRQSA